MNDKKIRKLVLAALLAALVCVATMVVQIPSPMQGFCARRHCGSRVRSNLNMGTRQQMRKVY